MNVKVQQCSLQQAATPRDMSGMGLYLTFVDLCKAFDTVTRDVVEKVMAKSGCPAWFTAMVRQLHDGRLARVQNSGEYYVSFL